MRKSVQLAVLRIPVAGAKELTGCLVIPHLKDASKTGAEKDLEPFQEIRVMGRMTRIK